MSLSGPLWDRTARSQERLVDSPLPDESSPCPRWSDLAPGSARQSTRRCDDHVDAYSFRLTPERFKDKRRPLYRSLATINLNGKRNLVPFHRRDHLVVSEMG